MSLQTKKCGGMALLACFERDFPTSDDKLMKRNFPLTVIIHWNIH